MTMKVVNVANGDYKLTVQNGGYIWLDVGDQSYNGKVVITGDLWVQGNTTTVSSETLTVKDNIIQLNEGGGTPTGISPTLDGQSGLLITRGGSGEYADAQFLFDENVSHLDASASVKNGTFSFRRNTGGAGTLVGIQTCSINTQGQNLYLINAPGPGVVSVTGTTNYERNVFDYTAWDLVSPTPTPPTGALPVTDDDALINVKGVQDYITSYNYYYRYSEILDGDTKVTTYDDSQGHSPSRIVFTVDSAERAQINNNGLNVDNVRVLTNTISNTSSNNLILTAATSNTVEIDGVLQLDDTTGPTAVSGVTKIYTVDSNNPGPGKTGVYFTSLGNSDELVAKNRALLFSILF